MSIKQAGNALMAAVGGRVVHPVNVRVGGFYRAPAPAELRPVAERLERARDAALTAVRWAAALPFDDSTFGLVLLIFSLRHGQL